MDLNLEALAQRILQQAKSEPRRFVVAIGGIPGSGKSTVAYPLVDLINNLSPNELAIGIGVDGWHYSQSDLRAMENPNRLFALRGAHFTFDKEGYAAFVQKLDTIDHDLPFPTFSHADKDPVSQGGVIRPHHRIVVIEGLHCLLNIHPWSEAAARYDEKIFVDTPLDVAEKRIIKRHLAEGVEPTVEAAARRAQQSDMLNARTLIANLVPPSVIVKDKSLQSRLVRAE